MTFLARAVDMWPLLALVTGLVPLAVAATVIVPTQRRKLRRMVLLVALTALVACTDLTVAALGFGASAAWLGVATWLLVAFTGVNLGAILLFDLALPRLGVSPAPIVYELALAGSWMFASVVVLTTSGVDLTGVVAASTVAAAILTISLQSTLGSVVGGVAVQFDRSIRAGDWIALSAGQEGRVREIRWRHTVVETREGDAIVVPNALLLSAVVTIIGRRDGRSHPHRISVDFLTDVAVPPDLVVATVTEALRASPIENIASEPQPDCACVDMGVQAPGFTRFRARAWAIDPMPDRPTHSRVSERVHAAMRRANLPFGSPTLGMYAVDHAPTDTAHLRRAARKLLDQVALLAPLTSDERDLLAPKLVYRPYANGEVITRQGATAHGLYLVGEGAVRVIAVGDGHPEPHELAILEAPSLFGEMGLLTGEARSASVVAVGRTVCWRLDKVDFDQILRERHQIAADLATLLATRQTLLARDLDHHNQRAHEVAEQARILDRIRAFFRL